jgi:hypothetical protein
MWQEFKKKSIVALARINSIAFNKELISKPLLGSFEKNNFVVLKKDENFWRPGAREAQRHGRPSTKYTLNIRPP